MTSRSTLAILGLGAIGVLAIGSTRPEAGRAMARLTPTGVQQPVQPGLPAPQQPGRGGPGFMPAGSTAVVFGSVIDAATGGPIANAVVRLDGAGLSRAQLTNTRGQFDFLALSAADYTVTASKSGYFDGAYGKFRPDGNGTPITLLSGQWLPNATIAIFRPAAIAGRVEDEAREPVVAARVQALRRLIIAGRTKLVPGPIATTDDRGEFRLFDLVAGDYVLAVPSLHITLPSLAISALATLSAGGRRPSLDATTLVNRNLGGSAFEAFLGPATARADPDGRHIVIGNASTIPPPPDDASMAYPTIFYPSATSPAAAIPITVGPGERREGLVLEIDPVPMHRVSGHIDGPPGAALGEILRLVPDSEDDPGLGLDAGTTMVDLDGTFAFFNVPPGRYVVEARSGVSVVLGAGGAQAPGRTPLSLSDSPVASTVPFTSSIGGGTMVTASLGGLLNAAPAYWGDADLVVGDSDPDDVVVTLQPTATIRGSVAFDAGTRPPVAALARIRVIADPADGSSTLLPPAHLDEDGTFAITGLPPGRYFIRTSEPPAGWTLKSATWEGTDFSVSPLDTHAAIDLDGMVVTFTTQPAVVTGTVRDAHGLVAVPLATVVVFPMDRSELSDYGLNPRRLQMVRAGVNGVFNVTGLPAGTYNLVAIDEASASGWQDPARLDAWRGIATVVTIRDGDQKTQDLRLTGSK